MNIALIQSDVDCQAVAPKSASKLEGSYRQDSPHKGMVKIRINVKG